MAVSTQALFEMSRKLTVKMNNNESQELRSRLQSQEDLNSHDQQRPPSWTIGGNAAMWTNRPPAEIEEEKVAHNKKF